MPIDLTISIVSYNTESDLVNCLRSIYDHPPRRTFQVIVVDNGSTDCSVEQIRLQFPQVVIIATGENLGYGRANNRALLGADGSYFAILNSDLVLKAGSLDKCCDYLDENPNVGIVGGALLNPDGSPQMDWAAGSLRLEAVAYEQFFLAHLFPKSRKFGDYFRSWWRRGDTRALPQVCGAFMVVRAEMYKKLCGFDSAYFMYCEDTDLCKRITDSRLECVYLDSAPAIHGHGKSSAGKLRPRMIFEHNRSRCIYFAKFVGAATAARARNTMVSGARLRCFLWTSAGSLMRRRDWRDKGESYVQVMKQTEAIDILSLAATVCIDEAGQSSL